MAIMHWSANVDCYDVEFVLGSEGETTYTEEEICRSSWLSVEQIASNASSYKYDKIVRTNFRRQTTVSGSLISICAVNGRTNGS